MAKNYTTHFKERVSSTSGEAPSYLLEISHDQLATPVRVTSDTNDIRRYAGTGAGYLNLPGSDDDEAVIGLDLDWAGDPATAEAVFLAFGGTCTRALATATRVNESGLIEIVAADTLRIGYDPVTLACRGLLIEEARTNLCLRSQEFNTSWVTTAASVSANTDTAPDGTTTADTLTASASVSGAIYQAFTLTVGATYAVSIFMKQGTATRSGIGLYDVTAGGWQGLLDVNWTSGVPSTSSTLGTVDNIKYEDYDNGWHRVSFTVPADAVNTSHRVYIYGDRIAGTNNTKIWGAQLEAGDSVTSYIPTTTATVARNRDVVKDSDISSFFNSSEGTMYVEATAVEPAANIGGGAAVTAEFHDGTTNERLMVYRTPTSVANAYNKTGGVVDVQRQAGAWADGATVRAAYAFKTNDFAVSLDGATVATDTVGTLATVSQLQLGASASNTQMLMGYLRRFTYFPVRLLDATLVSLSTDGVDIYDETYTSCAFRVHFPDDVAKTMPRAPISIDNIGRELTQWLEASGGGRGAEVRIMQVMRDTPDTIEQEYTLNLLNVHQGMMEVVGELGYENVLELPGLCAMQTPETQPGIF